MVNDITMLKGLVIVLVFLAVALVPTVNASGFLLKVSLYDGKVDSGRVNVVVQTATTKQTRSLDVGRIVKATGDSTIDQLVFGFSDKALPPNGAFKVCASGSGGQNCEQADRHGSAGSATIFVQVP